MKVKFVAVAVIGELESATIRMPLYNNDDLVKVKEYIDSLGVSFESADSLQAYLMALDEPVAIYGHNTWLKKLKEDLFGKQ